MRSVVFVFLALFAGPAVAEPPLWTVDHEQSRLGFVADQDGGDVEGWFEAWSAQITFDPDDLMASHIIAEINMASVETGSSIQESDIRSEGLFHVEAYPQGRFESLEITATGDESYEARGELTLRETTREVVLPFTLVIDGQNAQAEGGLTIKRLDYGIGQGDWEDTSVVANEVEIFFEIEARLDPSQNAQ